jgi:lipopolysaccharide biosynthesis glycosyltransferase
LRNPPYSRLKRAEQADSASKRAESLRAELAEDSSRRLRRADIELMGSLYWPKRHCSILPAVEPGPDVAFVTVANDRFYRGLEAMLLSLLNVYPGLTSTIYVVHDGSLGPFMRKRLCSLYSRISFSDHRPGWAEFLPKDSRNRKRIGVLGYLNSFALGLRGYRRVIVFDSDLLILDSLDPLWAESDVVYMAPDCGDRPWAAISSHTQRPVLNSGVISLPSSALCDEEYSRFEALVRSSSDKVCPLLDRFADQKVWNQWLLARQVEILPLNYNCNIKYLVQYLGGCPDGISVVHFAGPKPWLDWPWAVPGSDGKSSRAVIDHLFWNRIYRQLLYRWRLLLWQQVDSASVVVPDGAACLGVAVDDFSADLVADCASRHLLLAHYQIFGTGWPNEPAWPEGWLERMASSAPLWLWAPFEWEPALRELPLPHGVHWRWVLIEAPFSPDLAHADEMCVSESPWDAAFEPFAEPPLLALERAVRHRLAREGAIPLPSPWLQSP